MVQPQLNSKETISTICMLLTSYIRGYLLMPIFCHNVTLGLNHRKHTISKQTTNQHNTQIKGTNVLHQNINVWTLIHKVLTLAWVYVRLTSKDSTTNPLKVMQTCQRIKLASLRPRHLLTRTFNGGLDVDQLPHSHDRKEWPYCCKK